MGSGKESGRNEWTVRKAPGRRGREDGQENREGTVELRDSAGRLTSVSYLWGDQERVKGQVSALSREARGGFCSEQDRGYTRAEVGCGSRCVPHLG